MFASLETCGVCAICRGSRSGIAALPSGMLGGVIGVVSAGTEASGSWLLCGTEPASRNFNQQQTTGTSTASVPMTAT
jgi:hypothetical protein